MNEVKPIIDTDIWVYLVLTDYHERVLKRFGHFIFSDVVEKEIIKWNKNKDDSKKIASLFENYRKQGKLTVISINDFTREEQLVINHQLAEYGLKRANIQEKNKGEFVSLLYAIHKNIKRFKTNDRKFIAELDDDITEAIEIVNWDDVLRLYSTSIKERSETMKLLGNREKDMKKGNSELIDPRWEKLKSFVV